MLVRQNECRVCIDVICGENCNNKELATFRWVCVTLAAVSDILKCLCQKVVLHSDFYIQFPSKPPQKLEDWLKANHPETRALEAEMEAGG
jgi:hypothetical protein